MTVTNADKAHTLYKLALKLQGAASALRHGRKATSTQKIEEVINDLLRFEHDTATGAKE